MIERALVEIYTLRNTPKSSCIKQIWEIYAWGIARTINEQNILAKLSPENFPIPNERMSTISRVGSKDILSKRMQTADSGEISQESKTAG